MPYIKKERRAALDGIAFPKDAGELNYTITMFCIEYLKNTEERYADYNAIIGVLESAKLEFYRRAVSKYEDKKIIENSDVYEES